MSMKSWFKSNEQIQIDFIKSYNEGVKSLHGEEEYTRFVFIFSIVYTVLWVNFYITAFNIFNYGQLVFLSLVGVFYLLESIYGFFNGLNMLDKKEIKVGSIQKLLDTVELAYVIYFIIYYIRIN